LGGRTVAEKKGKNDEVKQQKTQNQSAGGESKKLPEAISPEQFGKKNHIWMKGTKPSLKLRVRLIPAMEETGRGTRGFGIKNHQDEVVKETKRFTTSRL